jgi:hypothetical protein
MSKLQCAQCGATYNLTPTFVARFSGKRGTCHKCGASVQLPTAARVQSLSYETPRPYTVPGEITCWRDDADAKKPALVVLIGASTPDRCVKCNAPANGYTFSQTFAEEVRSTGGGSNAVAVAADVAIAVSQLARRKKGLARIALCPEHRRRRTRSGIIGGCLTFVGIGFVGPSFYYLLNHNAPQSSLITAIAFIAAAFLVMFIGIFWIALGTVPVRFVKIIDQHMWLKGAGLPFLASLPSYEAPAARATSR